MQTKVETLSPVQTSNKVVMPRLLLCYVPFEAMILSSVNFYNKKARRDPRFNKAVSFKLVVLGACLQARER